MKYWKQIKAPHNKDIKHSDKRIRKMNIGFILECIYTYSVCFWLNQKKSLDLVSWYEYKPVNSGEERTAGLRCL